MRLKIVDVRSRSESDSDYETAVELSHWSMLATAVLFETSGGVRFEVHSREEVTTYSYLEPDFEHMERTGQTVYVSHESAAQTKTFSQCTCSNLYIAQPAQIVPTEEMVTVLAWADRDELEHLWEDNLPRDQRARMVACLAQIRDSREDGRPLRTDDLLDYEQVCSVGDGVLIPPNPVEVIVTEQDVSTLKWLAASKGKFVDAQMSDGFESSILEAERKHASIVKANSLVRDENRVNLAKARIFFHIDNMATEAHIANECAIFDLRSKLLG